jgi:hypothetical protein
MAYKKLTFDRYNERKQIVDRLKRCDNPFAYTAEITLAEYDKAVEAVKMTTTEKNAALDVVSEKTLAHNAACEKEEKLLIALRACIGSDKGKNSDEFVFAGGTRQSDIVAQQQLAREEKRKASEEDAKTKA